MRRAAGMGLWLCAWGLGVMALSLAILTMRFAWLTDRILDVAKAIHHESVRIERMPR